MASACTVVLANDAAGGGGIGGLGSAGIGGLRSVRASSCLLMTTAVVAAVVLVVAGVFVVREYSLSASYEPASCRVENVTYALRDAVCLHCSTVAAGEKAGKDRTSGAGSACMSVQFPCVAVSVFYTRAGESSDVHEHRALLHTDSLQAAGVHNQVNGADSFSVSEQDVCVSFARCPRSIREVRTALTFTVELVSPTKNSRQVGLQTAKRLGQWTFRGGMHWKVVPIVKKLPGCMGMEFPLLLCGRMHGSNNSSLIK
jgi:hypothetical protein